MEILFSDKEIVVCIKPVGMDSEQDVPQALQQQLGGEIFTLHRLDKNVGGVMLYGRTKASAARFSKLIQDGQLIKEYVALVHGTPPQEGDLTDLLWKDSSKNKVFVVKRERRGVKKARLTYRLLQAGEQSLVRVRLYTGRSHQIRVQFASRGFPLVGDHKYGSRDEASAPMLYSCCLTFPYGGKEQKFESLPPWA
jgi:23S rRNA pseudouridine1911/1915/1917 synthase